MDNVRESEAACPECGHPDARHEASVEDEFVASHGGVGYAICQAVVPGGEAGDRCGCRMVIGGPREAAGKAPDSGSGD